MVNTFRFIKHSFHTGQNSKSSGIVKKDQCFSYSTDYVALADEEAFGMQGSLCLWSIICITLDFNRSCGAPPLYLYQADLYFDDT